MARFMRNITNAMRPFKRIRNEIGAVKSDIVRIREHLGSDIRNILAYHILRDSNVAHKDELLMALYPKNGEKVGVTSDIATMKRYLNAVRPVRSDFIVQNLVRVGGANDGGYILINPKIDLLDSSNAMREINIESQDYGANPIVSAKFTRNNAMHDSPPPIC